MTVNDLICILEQMDEEGKGNYEVKLLMQPNYPFIYSVGKTGTRQIAPEEEPDCEGECAGCEDRICDKEVFVEGQEEAVFYLCEGIQESYGFNFDHVESFHC